MFHQHFRTQWKEDSYWKHYYNYQQQKEDDQYYAMIELRKKLLKELVKKHGPVLTRRGITIDKDGWEMVL